jgi:hypothetical protein
MLNFSYRCPHCDHCDGLELPQQPVDATQVVVCPRCGRSLSLHLTCTPQRLFLRVESPQYAPLRFEFDRTVRDQRAGEWTCLACGMAHAFNAEPLTEGQDLDLEAVCPLCLTAHALRLHCADGQTRVVRALMLVEDDHDA